MKHLLIDYGGTNFRWQLSNDLNTSVTQNLIGRHSSDSVKLTVFLDQFKAQNLTSIRISFAGQVKNGVIYSSPNTALKGFNLQDYVEKNFADTKLFIENDLNCAALAEYNQIGAKNLGVCYIGTGFGMSVVIDGKVIKGANNIANEIGHLPFKKSDLKCGCGRDDCIELFCSGNALKRRCYQIDTNLSYHNLHKLQQQTKTKQIYKDFIQALQKAVQISVTLYDFDTIVFGGSVFLNNVFLKDIVQKELTKLPFAKQRKIRLLSSNLSEGSLEGTRFL